VGAQPAQEPLLDTQELRCLADGVHRPGSVIKTGQRRGVPPGTFCARPHVRY
jgi:hypothetical protein